MLIDSESAAEFTIFITLFKAYFINFGRQEQGTKLYKNILRNLQLIFVPTYDNQI